MAVSIVRRTVPTQAYEDLKRAGLHPLAARIYAARQITQTKQLDPDLSYLHPLELLELEPAATRLLRAKDSGERICIVGDYDCDGATSTALLMTAFRTWGMSAFYILPNRFTQGYGLSPELVDSAKEQGADLIVTVDNGINAVSAVERAKEIGMDVIITDHHLPGQLLPDTPYIVNPNKPNSRFPSSALCGVGVAFYLTSMLWKYLVQRGECSVTEPFPRHVLDLAALGTVADVVPLDANNRRIIQAGLRHLRNGTARPGIRSLLEVANIPEHLTTERDLAFSLAPRINAAGRLEDMTIGVELLLATDLDEALPYAQQLDQLNRQRRTLEQDRLESTLERLQEQVPTHDRVLAVLDPDGHEGVVGLIAGRLKERFFCPVIVFAPAEDPNLLKGSARSVPGVHIRDLLAAVHAQHPGLMEKFGGHAMAAGLTIQRGRFAEFQHQLRVAGERLIDPGLLSPVEESDGSLAESQMHCDTVRFLQSLGPWGQGFPAPAFDNAFLVLESRRVGSDRQTLRLRLSLLAEDAPTTRKSAYTAIRFRQGDAVDPSPGQSIRLLYRPEINWYQGVESVQLMILSWEAL